MGDACFQYTVTMFIIDVSPSMGDMRTVELPPGPGGEPRSAQMTNLEWALKYVKLKIQQMVGGLHANCLAGVTVLSVAFLDIWRKKDGQVRCSLVRDSRCGLRSVKG